MPDDGLHIGFGVAHVVLQVCERHLGLDHVELGQVPRGLAVLGPECGSERVHVPHGARVGLPRELPRHGQVGGGTKEILGVVDAVLLPFHPRQLRNLARQGGDSEHLAGALAIRGRDDRALQVVESLLLEEFVRGKSQGGPDAGHGGQGVGAWSQVGDPPEELERVALLLERVGLRIAASDHLHALRCDFILLALSWARLDHAHDTQGSPCVYLGEDGLVVADLLRVRHHLQPPQGGAVVYFDETEGFLRANCAGPSLDRDALPDQTVVAIDQYVPDFQTSWHGGCGGSTGCSSAT